MRFLRLILFDDGEGQFLFSFPLRLAVQGLLFDLLEQRVGMQAVVPAIRCRLDLILAPFVRSSHYRKSGERSRWRR